MGERLTSETFISRFSDEVLKREVFADLLEAKVLIEDYRSHYSHRRLHSALGYLTPAEFGVGTDLDRKVENAGMLEELQSVPTLYSTWYRKRGQATAPLYPFIIV